jgi:hypothetical protein
VEALAMIDLCVSEIKGNRMTPPILGYARKINSLGGKDGANRSDIPDNSACQHYSGILNIPNRILFL